MLKSSSVKSHDQVICDFQGQEVFGGATCPFCGKRTELDISGSPYRDWVVVSKIQRCEHADMAVEAGGLDVAIHFINRGVA